MSVGPAKFDPNRCNESPQRGEKPDFWPVSKNNTGSLPLRGILPVIINTLLGTVTRHPAGMHCPAGDDAFVSSFICNSVTLRGRRAVRSRVTEFEQVLCRGLLFDFHDTYTLF